MALCNYAQTSFFWRVFDPQKDFNYNMIFQMPEREQMIMDPVGFFYFNRQLVYMILAELRKINGRRTDLRDLLKEMGYIWRFNNMQHQVLNEADWTDRNDVAKRVNQLVELTRNKLQLRERVTNMVTGDVIRYWENQIPQDHPAATTEKMSSTLQMQVPHVDQGYTQPPFKPVSAFNRRVYIRGR